MTARSDEPMSLRVLKVIKRLTCATVVDIMRETGMERKDVRTACQGIHKQGFIRTVGHQNGCAIYVMAHLGYIRVEKKWGCKRTAVPADADADDEDRDEPLTPVKAWDVPSVVQRTANSVFQLAEKS